jgi:hypothetical protein
MFLSPSNARASFIFSYTTMIGLAGQSSRWKTAMERELTLASQKASQATAWQAASAEDKAASEALAEESRVEQDKATYLQEKAERLAVKAKSGQTKAAMAKEEAEGLSVEAAGMEAESDALLVEAGADETIVEKDTVRGTKEAVLAADDAGATEADEAATAACQLIPVLDVVCDVVGGVAAVGLESQSVRYAAMAAENFAAAAAVQVEVDSATAEATELQTKATQEAEEAEALESEATALETQAEEELAQAQADEADAEKNLAHSVLDEASAGEEDAKAAAEEDATASAWDESVQHGASACGNALIMSVISAFAILFWSLRIAGSALLPCITSGKVWVAGFSSGHSNRFVPAAVHNLSHICNHIGFFVIFFGVWGAPILRLRHLSIKSMGGVLLGFAASASAAQSLLMHALPKGGQHEGSLQARISTICHEFTRRMLVLCPLTVFEILLLWVNAGTELFVPSVVHLAQSWYLFVVLAATVTAHHACFTWHTCSGGKGAEKEGSPRLDFDGGDNHPLEDSLLLEISPQKTCANYGSDENSIELNDGTNDDEWDEIRSSETHSKMLLLHAASCIPDEPRVLCREQRFHEMVMDDCKSVRLLLFFELLMASVTIAFFRQSSPMVLALWPASKVPLLAAWSHWKLVVLASTVAAMSLLICACW